MKIKILYAEDDEFTRKFEIRRLKECGFNVSSVEDGQEAWDEYQKGRYDLLLLDGDMPKMQGEEVMRLVREAGDDIAIVIYSGLPDYSLLNEGVDECIDKGTRNSQEVEWRIKTALIVFQKVCKFQFIYFCNRTVKNNLLWNLHLSK